jgi:hypothetical protein
MDARSCGHHLTSFCSTESDRETQKTATAAATTAWPEPTELAELHRSGSVKNCVDMLKRTAASASAAERECRATFEAAMQSMTDEIRAAIETVAEADTARIEELVKCAAELWLKLASQRYRSRVYMPPDAGNVLGGGRKAGGTAVTLAVKLELRRRGTAQFQRLNREQVIQGCEGEAVLSSRI